MNVNPREILNDLKAMKAERVSEPPAVERIRSDVRKDFVCGFCGASRRADVHYLPRLSGKDEIAVDVECRAFLRDEKTGNPEICGHTETRYYPR